jgi:hypothetical protein
MVCNHGVGSSILPRSTSQFNNLSARGGRPQAIEGKQTVQFIQLFETGSQSQGMCGAAGVLALQCNWSREAAERAALSGDVSVVAFAVGADTSEGRELFTAL